MNWDVVFARLSFWFGFSWQDVIAMPVGAIQMYLEQLESLTAEKSLMLAEAATFPYLSDSSRRSRRDEWMQLAARGQLPTMPPTPPEILRLHGIGVQFVPVKAKKKTGK